MRYLFFILIFFGCNKNNTNIDLIIDEVNSIYAPDKRVSLFNITYSISNATVVIYGETSKIEAKNYFLQKLDSVGINYSENIVVLPKDTIYGIINNSVGNLRGRPSHSSELVSQTLLGTRVKVLKKEGEWYLIQTPDEYISWIDHGGISIISEGDYNNYYKNPYIFSSVQGFAYSSIEKEAIISDLVVGSVLNVTDKIGDF